MVIIYDEYSYTGEFAADGAYHYYNTNRDATFFYIPANVIMDSIPASTIFSIEIPVIAMNKHTDIHSEISNSSFIIVSNRSTVSGLGTTD